MEKQELKKILDLHEKWLKGEIDGEEADLEEANLEGADLRNVNLRGVNFRGADLDGANLKGANLKDANLKDADLGDVTLEDANLEGADLGGVYLRNANLKGANLKDADLEGADLRYTTLEDADLEGANLRGVDLRNVNLRGVNLRGADLDYSCLPLWCGSLSANFDDKQLKQIAYHLVKAGLNSNNATEETKAELSKLIDFANGFHRVTECGRIEKKIQQCMIYYNQDKEKGNSPKELKMKTLYEVVNTSNKSYDEDIKLTTFDLNEAIDEAEYWRGCDNRENKECRRINCKDPQIWFTEIRVYEVPDDFNIENYENGEAYEVDYICNKCLGYNIFEF